MNGRSFTLVELLIVVAIIGILAAVAVPNFLNARLRASVARCDSELYGISTALQSYYLDNNKYPGYSRRPNQDVYAMMNVYVQLTTPIAYMQTVPPDPFLLHADYPIAFVYWFWDLPAEVPVSPWDNGPPFMAELGAIERGARVLNASMGPDRMIQIPLIPRVPRRDSVYDSSNGLHSSGDIPRFTPYVAFP